MACYVDRLDGSQRRSRPHRPTEAGAIRTAANVSLLLGLLLLNAVAVKELERVPEEPRVDHVGRHAHEAKVAQHKAQHVRQVDAQGLRGGMAMEREREYYYFCGEEEKGDTCHTSASMDAST
jgi:hypothetical protein